MSTLLLLAIIILTIIFSAGKTAVPPTNLRPGYAPANPSAQHIFGLGMYGEDYFTEIWVGAKTTFLFVLAVIAIQVIVGIVLGLI